MTIVVEHTRLLCKGEAAVMVTYVVFDVESSGRHDVSYLPLGNESSTKNIAPEIEELREVLVEEGTTW